MDQDSENINFLCDFIYVDFEKLKSFSARINEHGHMTQFASTEHKTVHNERASHIGMGKIAHTDKKSGKESGLKHEAQYDPTWPWLLDVINQLQEKGFIGHEPKQIGQLLLLTGEISVLDVQLMRDFIPIMPEFEKIPEFKNAQMSNAPTDKQELRLWKTLNRLAPKMLNILPNSLQLSLTSRNGKHFWGNLERNKSIANASALAMMYGENISGKWNLLCSLDAFPDTEETEPDSAEQKSGAILHNMVIAYSDLIRSFIGRPSHAYGITPIAIYRLVHRQDR
ncbi:DUF6414 family protein [Magnetococcales bacterium HHB-1]